KTEKSRFSRRKFVKGAATMAAVAATVPLKPLLGGPGSTAEASTIDYEANKRTNDSFIYRRNTAIADKINIGEVPDNGDLTTFKDFSANFSKTLRHDGLGVPNKMSYQSFIDALTAESFLALNNVITGTPGGGPNSKMNGPATAFAFDLEGLDSHAYTIPPAPSVATAQTATEEVEHFWAALLRDVPFTEYASNPTVAEAVADLNSRSFIQSGGANQWPRPVTAANLFRGQVFVGDGNVKGPYISQFLLQPTFFGNQPISQLHQTFLPNQAFLTDVGSYQAVQNGGASGEPLMDPTFRFIRNGRDLTAYTRVDALHQAYFVASLVLAGIRAPLNPGNPYNTSPTQKAFGTLGAPDAFATIPEVATRALKASWFRKWVADLRLRPEEYGALLEARRIHSSPVPQASNALHSDVLTSAVLPKILAMYGSHLMPVAFPEGSPTHPCYTGGHATVAGACATTIKFFFDGKQKIRPLLLAAGTDLKVPTPDGLSLVTYTGADRDTIDINGELSKLAFNIPFGHGVHSGIHFRSSNHWGILLGEMVALSVLQDKAKGYNEPFTINITKFDGTTATITNQNLDSIDSMSLQSLCTSDTLSIQ
ncbi:MAG TPA: twin-arginine translocation signal domain-containing protein, partial [Pyrinomonadaceae bacterium]|nr:twin-arginine translocation signal domain-containing protein [Pyrinomonadaceae bacterium]